MNTGQREPVPDNATDRPPALGPGCIGAERAPARGSIGAHHQTTEGTPVAEQLYATLKTSQGDIEIRLLPNHAPRTVKNFVELARGEREWTHPATGEKTTDRLYDGTVFHRVLSGFMIQGGDPLGNGTGDPGYQFADEFHPDLAFDRPYLLAMANAGPGTNGSQFFVTVSPTTWLNRKHTIFGEVTDPASQKVVDTIAAAQTNPRTHRPVNDVVIETVVVETRQG